MNASDHIGHSLAFIEAHLTKPLTVEQVAAAAGYSRFHYSRSFLMLTGLTPTDYVRKRRLSEAARELVTSAKRILDIALDYQFGSQEAFTRSFKREFGVTPSLYRQRGRLHRLWGKISLGVANLLYPGKGIHRSSALLIPKRRIVAAIVTPRLPSNQQGAFPGKFVMTTIDTITIRLAHRQDIGALCQLYYEFHEYMVQGVPQRLQSLGDYECFNASSLTLSLQKLMDAVDVAMWVAELNGQVVGLAEVYLRADAQEAEIVAYRYGYLQSLFVKRQFRGRGIGAQLLAAAEAWARQHGAAELRLEMWEFAQGPLGFYQQQGYGALRRTLVRAL